MEGTEGQARGIGIRRQCKTIGVAGIAAGQGNGLADDTYCEGQGKGKS